MKKITKKLLMAILSVSFALVALGTVTFAWFTLTNTATILPIDIDVSTDDGLEIAMGKLTINEEGIALANKAWFTELDEETFWDYLEADGYNLDEFALKNVTSEDGVNFTDRQKAPLDSKTGGFLEFDVSIRSLVANQNVYLTKDTSVSSNAIEWKADANFIGSHGNNVNPGDVINYYTANSARMSFNSEDGNGNSYDLVYELPEYAVSDTMKGFGVSTIYGNKAQGTKAIFEGAVSYYNAKHTNSQITNTETVKLAETITSFLGADPVAFISDKNQDENGYYYTDVTVRIWLEGWDADCIDSIIDDSLRVSLQFTNKKQTGYRTVVNVEGPVADQYLPAIFEEHLEEVGETASMDDTSADYPKTRYELVASKLTAIVEEDQVVELFQTYRLKRFTITVEDSVGNKTEKFFRWGDTIDLSDLDNVEGYRIVLYQEESYENLYESNSMPVQNLFGRYEVNEYKITFELNGGVSEDPLEIVYEYGETIEEPNEPTKEGHTFKGWYKDAALTVPMDFTDFIMPAEHLTVYADWTVNSYNIRFAYTNENGDLVTLTTLTENYGANLIPPIAPSLPGQTFAGWYLDELFEEPYEIPATMPAKSFTVYAKFE